MRARKAPLEEVAPPAPHDRLGGAGRADGALLHDLLVKTSRTFALAIPLLPRPTARQVTVAYLLFRIADTFEDASVLWDRPRQLGALAEFEALLGAPSAASAERLAAAWLAAPPTRNRGYLELLERSPAVIEAFAGLAPEARRIVGEHTARTARGMASVVERAAGGEVLQLGSIPDLKEYCYIVAGIVGEMLTELFLLDRPKLAPVAGYLRQRAAAFGEALQLVNILKDSASDATEGRNYVPSGIDRRAVFELARRDLAAAAEYTLAVQRAGGPRGLVLFTGLPLELAWATLERVERDGPGAKLTRREVFAIQSRLLAAVASGRPAVSAPAP